MDKIVVDDWGQCKEGGKLGSLSPHVRAGKLTKLLDTDWQCFGGRTEKPKRLVGKACGGELKLTLAPFSGQLFKLV